MIVAMVSFDRFSAYCGGNAHRPQVAFGDKCAMMRQKGTICLGESFEGEPVFTISVTRRTGRNSNCRNNYENMRRDEYVKNFTNFSCHRDGRFISICAALKDSQFFGLFLN